MELSLSEFRLKAHDEKFDLFERRHEEHRQKDHEIRAVLTKDAYSIQELFTICDQNVKNLMQLSESMLVLKSDVTELKTDKKIEQGVHDRFFKFIQIGKVCMPVLVLILVLLQSFDLYKVSANSETLYKNAARVKDIVNDITK